MYMNVKRKFKGDLYINFIVDENKIFAGDDFYQLTVNNLSELFGGDIDIVFEDDDFLYDQESNNFKGMFKSMEFKVPATVRNKMLLQDSIEHKLRTDDVILGTTVNVEFK